MLIFKTSSAALAWCALSLPVCAAQPTLEDLWQVVQAQQQQINTLQSKLRETSGDLEKAVGKLDLAAVNARATNEQVAAVDQKIEATADLLEQVTSAAPSESSTQMTTTNTAQSSTAVGAAGARWSPSTGRRRIAAGSWAKKTTIGGYGELHYNNLEDSSFADGDADDVDRVDFHRFVLFASHNFNDWLRFASEIEIEHSLAGEGQPGEVELELAWIEADLNQNHHVRAGMDILPIGLLNLTHEPNTFYGVERNPVEKEIIPSTWWESSVALWGELLPGITYNLYVHSGLVIPTTGGSRFRPRSGRTKSAQADNQDIAVMGRLLYNGTPGLEIAATVDYQADYTGTADAAEADAWLFETHIDYRHNSGLRLRALYAGWYLDKDIDAGLNPDAVGADTLDGWYVEPSYRFSTVNVLPGELGLFMRYQQWDERNNLGAFQYEQFDMFNVGLNYWPHPQVVVKFDAQWQSADGPVAAERNGFNLGLGYQF